MWLYGEQILFSVLFSELALFQFPDCQPDKDEGPRVTDFVAQIKKDKIVVSF